MKNKVVKIEVTKESIVYFFLFLTIGWFSYQIRDVIMGLFISLVIVGVMNPLVERLESFKFPRWLAILFLYLVFLSALFLMLWGVVPVIQQGAGLVKFLSLPANHIKFTQFDISRLIIDKIDQGFASFSQDFVSLIFMIFSNIIGVLGILVISFYLLLEHEKMDHYLFYLFGKEGKKRGKRVIDNLERKLGGWLRAEVALMFIVGTMSYLGFKFLGLKFALPLGILAGLLEIVPNIGPILASIPGILSGLAISPVTALVVAAWCFIVQQLENNLIVPKIMKSVVGVNPVITLLSLTIGFDLAGTAGMILAIPFYITAEVFFREFFSGLKKKSK